MKARRLRMIAARCVNAAFWFTSGAYALAIYIEATNRSLSGIRDLRRDIWFVWFGLLILSGLLRRNRARHSRGPSPATSGTAVVVETGLAGVAFVIENDPTIAGVALAAGIASMTLVVAGLVYRFASRNADQIGEARFCTSGASTSRA
jgi:hypothetical protein